MHDLLNNLPQMWDSMRRNITQSGNENNTMTFKSLRCNMESELIARKESQPADEQDVSQALIATRKRPRLRFQRTQGATCTKCKKPNHTAQQCGKTISDNETLDGSAQLTTSAAPQHNPNHINYDEDYDSDVI